MTIQEKIQAVRDEIIAQIGTGRADLKSLESKFAALEAEHKQQLAPPARLIDRLKADKDLTAFISGRAQKAQLLFEGADAAVFERKAISDASVGYAISGVLPAQRLGGITQEPRQPLLVEALFSSDTTSAQLVDYIRATNSMTPASPQVEAGDKGSNSQTFSPASERIGTVATVLDVTRQLFDDYAGLVNFLTSTMAYQVNLQTELQILSGSGAAPNLDGLIGQASAFDTSLLQAATTQPDFLGLAALQLAGKKEIAPTFAIVNALDYWRWRLSKSTTGSYLLAELDETGPLPRLFGLDIVPTTSMSSGTFLVGSGSSAVGQVVNRQEILIEFARSHNLNFSSNLITCRAERRLAMVCKRPGSFIYGNYNSSPA